MSTFRVPSQQRARCRNTRKRGKKRGRRTMNESIQMVGESMVNSGRVIPLSEVFHQPLTLLK